MHRRAKDDKDGKADSFYTPYNISLVSPYGTINARLLAVQKPVHSEFIRLNRYYKYMNNNDCCNDY